MPCVPKLGTADLLIGGMTYQAPPAPTAEPASLLRLGTGVAVLVAKKRYSNLTVSGSYLLPKHRCLTGNDDGRECGKRLTP